MPSIFCQAVAIMGVFAWVIFRIFVHHLKEERASLVEQLAAERREFLGHLAAERKECMEALDRQIKELDRLADAVDGLTRRLER